MNNNIQWDEINSNTIIISNPKNIYHFTNVKCSLGYAIITKKETILFVDSRYIEMAQKTFLKGKVILLKNITTLIPFLDHTNSISIESDFVTLDSYNNFKKLNKEIIHVNGQKLREIKTQEEINNLNKAIKITKQVMEWASKQLKENITEKEIAWKIFCKLKKLGSEELDYPIIASFGVNTSLPHAEPSNKKLKDKENVMFDFGAVINGYTADITRNYFFGKVNKEIVKIKQIVKKAQQKAIESIKPGILSSSIDKICRDIIKKEGYEKEFTHSTGHGLGRDVHELPNVNILSKTILKPGHVITVEPGIYIPNLGGIRIEDDILVTEKGYRILGED